MVIFELAIKFLFFATSFLCLKTNAFDFSIYDCKQCIDMKGRQCILNNDFSKGICCDPTLSMS